MIVKRVEENRKLNLKSHILGFEYNVHLHSVFSLRVYQQNIEFCVKYQKTIKYRQYKHEHAPSSNCFLFLWLCFCYMVLGIVEDVPFAVRGREVPPFGLAFVFVCMSFFPTLCKKCESGTAEC